MLFAASCWAYPAAAQGEPQAEPQAEPKGFVCSFSTGTSSIYENGAFKVKPPVALNFEIADIDLDGQTAHLITDGQNKAGALKIVRAINANHFLEVVNEGFLNLTTVYDKDPATGRHPGRALAPPRRAGPAGVRAICRVLHREVGLPRPWPADVTQLTCG